MMNFLNAPIWLRGFIGLWVLAALYQALALVVICEEKKRPMRALIGLAGLGLYLAFQCIQSITVDNYADAGINPIYRAFAACGVIPGLLILILVTIWEVRLLRAHMQFKNSHLSGASVKEAVDFLPAGICCYEDNGHVILKNTAIDDICREMTGQMLLNGCDFASSLKAQATTLENRQLLILGERVYQIEEQTISDKKRQILTAVDITEEYKKHQELAEKRRDVLALNEKLHAYNKEITSIITQKEHLNAKIQIHDRMGKGLLLAKRYITGGGTEEMKAEILQELTAGVSFLLNESGNKPTDPFERIFKTAERLEARIVVNGELPTEPAHRQILATAMHECLTNTLRHAGGDEICVGVNDIGPVVKAEFTNNGRKPDGPITEQGGLGSLRSLVEAAGGQMTIAVSDGFKMTIILPKEKKDGI